MRWSHPYFSDRVPVDCYHSAMNEQELFLEDCSARTTLSTTLSKIHFTVRRTDRYRHHAFRSRAPQASKSDYRNVAGCKFAIRNDGFGPLYSFSRQLYNLIQQYCYVGRRCDCRGRGHNRSFKPEKVVIHKIQNYVSVGPGNT